MSFFISEKYFFKNEYSLSVVGGFGCYGNGIDTFEVAIVKNDRVVYNYDEIFNSKFRYYSGITFYIDDVLYELNDTQINLLREYLTFLKS